MNILLLATALSVPVSVPAEWISGNSVEPEKPAPALVRELVLDGVPRMAELRLAVAGWCEIGVNGRKCGRSVLEPVTCQPDERISELVYDVTSFLHSGTNEIAVLLGNGWFNCFTQDVWGFCCAPWLSAPKICGTLMVDGVVRLVTDGAWMAYDSPIVFDSLRNGEWYDARLESVKANLRPVTVEKYAPWGVVSPEDAEPCVEGELFAPVAVLKDRDGNTIYDFGVNIAGWCEIDVLGTSGAKVSIDYDESLTPSNTPLGHVALYVRQKNDPRPAQHDEYTLAGRSQGESWHPRFTYHGFRYARVVREGDVRITGIRARFVHSGFKSIGGIKTSDRTFSALQSATLRSYLSNFTGIPTDCPHREKNGWTADAQLAMETGLWNFDARKGYVHFLRMMLDAQKPNGAVPCILPCTPRFGFGWGSGPAWDMALFEIPEQLYRFYGDDAPAREAYSAMKRYLAFIERQADAEGLFAYGLGDWCSYKDLPTASLRMTDSAHVYEFNRRVSVWARRFGDAEGAAMYLRRSQEICEAFNRAFYKGDGIYETGHPTALACALNFPGLCVAGEEAKVAKRLAAAARERHHQAYFGVLGAKWVPRALAKYGYIDDAWAYFVQMEMPGWARWLQFGDGTLREKWDDTQSHNHIMFGDLSAWAYEYVAGIVPLEPGFGKIAMRPQAPRDVESFSVTHRTKFGEIKMAWRRKNGKLVYDYSVPPGIELVEAPDRK